MNNFARFVLDSPTRLVCPIVSYPELSVPGISAHEIVTRAEAQVAAQAALFERYQSAVVMACMDLSVEAEAFGSAIQVSAHEAPTVVGRLVSDRASIDALKVPNLGAGRTNVALEAAKRLKELPGPRFALGSCIGPLSLAARLFGTQETLELSLSDPPLLHAVLEKCTRFLEGYLAAFKARGADGVFVCEPVAGLLSPSQMRYVKRISVLADDGFALVLHDCAAKLVHLTARLDSGATMFHFGAPMQMQTALERVPPEVVLWGNLDPFGVFTQLTPEQIATRTRALLHETKGHANFVLSSGCDVPPATPLTKLDALFEASRQFEGDAN
ncbi:MAG: uroporphyrinogen decarboxylase family protein [Myxococcales bacterium]